MGILTAATKPGIFTPLKKTENKAERLTLVLPVAHKLLASDFSCVLSISCFYRIIPATQSCGLVWHRKQTAKAAMEYKEEVLSTQLKLQATNVVALCQEGISLHGK